MEKDIYNNELKYYMDGSHMVAMNGEPNRYTNFMHAYNTWLNYFWSSYFSGDWWAQDQFLCQDIRETTELLIGLFNSSEDNVNGKDCYYYSLSKNWL